VFKPNGADLHELAELYRKSSKPARQAKVVFQDGQILKTEEVPARDLDTSQVPASVIKVLPEGDSVDLPLRGAGPRVPKDELDKINDVVGEFSTRFPTWNTPRCWNIRLASSKLRGIILMPGEKLSFNGTVGRRTLRRGFRLAGVYKNGKHDVGIGGGICQVSTTLYNACLLSDLRIRQRSNHSLPVPYVPLGRDATVDYGDLDLVVQNSFSTPVAIDSQYEPGHLTFRVLGQKDPTLSVKIVRTGMRSWNPGVKLVVDRTLKPGKKRMVLKGNLGHSVATYRLVFKDGALQSRELLGRSTYGAHAWIMAYNPAPKAAPRTGPPIKVGPALRSAGLPGPGG
jgi:vancomycin resistance protein YoaR